MNGINMQLLTKIRNNRRKDRYQIQKLIDEHQFYSIKLKNVPTIKFNDDMSLKEMKEFCYNIKVAIIDNQTQSTEDSNLIPLILTCYHCGSLVYEHDSLFSMTDNISKSSFCAKINLEWNKLLYDRPNELRLYNIATKSSYPLLKASAIPQRLQVSYEKHNPYTNHPDSRFVQDPFCQIISPLLINGYVWDIEYYSYDQSFDMTIPLEFELGGFFNAFNLDENCSTRYLGNTSHFSIAHPGKFQNYLFNYFG